MYYEIAEVKKYESVSKKTGKVRVKSQVNVPMGSKFSEPKPIALVDIQELKEFINSNDVTKFNEIQAKFNTTSEELVKIKQQLQ